MSSRPRVLLVSTNADRAGAPKHIAELIASDTFRSAFDVTLCVGARGFLTEVCDQYGITVNVVPELQRAVRPLRDYRAYRKIVSLMRELRPALVHAHSSKAGVLARLAADSLAIPSVFTAHGWPFSPGTPRRQQLYSLPVERHLARKTASIIAVSEFDKQLAADCKVGDPDQVNVIHNGLSDTRLRATPTESGEINVVMVARFVPQKDYKTLISAIPYVGEKAKFHLVGGGEGLEQAKKLVADTGVEHRVRFHGEIDNVPDILSSSQFFVLASNWEGLPISVLEAMRCGLPVIASDVGGVGEAVVHGETGYLVRVADQRELASRIDELAANPGLRRVMGSAGRERYVRLFRANQMIEKTMAVYDLVRASG